MYATKNTSPASVMTGSSVSEATTTATTPTHAREKARRKERSRCSAPGDSKTSASGGVRCGGGAGSRKGAFGNISLRFGR
jgi:hypothetical protein